MSTTRPAAQAVRHLRQHQLRLLELVHEYGSLSGAAHELRLTQPALTRMLHDLETAFGQELVLRNSKGAALSEAGLQVMRRVQRSLAWVEEAWNELQSHPSRPRLRLGYMPFVGAQVLPHALAELGGQQPPTRFSVTESTLTELLAGLLSGRMDAIIAVLDAADVSQLASEPLTLLPLYQERLSIACGSSLHAQLPGRNRLADLAGHRWVIAPHGTRTRRVFDAAFLAEGVLPPEPEIESGAYHANLSMVGLSSELLTVCPHSALVQYGPPSGVQEVRLVRPLAQATVNLVVHLLAASLPEMQALATALRKAARSAKAVRD